MSRSRIEKRVRQPPKAISAHNKQETLSLSLSFIVGFLFVTPSFPKDAGGRRMDADPDDVQKLRPHVAFENAAPRAH